MIPRFSIVLTTYNRAKLLERALNSLIHQKFENWEAIIVNDGSTDETEKIISPYLKTDARFHYHKQTNQGEAKAKNKGVELAKGEYISFLDSDDEYEINHLESRNNLLNLHPEVDLLHGGVQIIGDTYVPDKNNPEQLIHLSECIIGGTFFIRNSCISLLEGFKDIPLGTDSDLFDRAVENNMIILKTDLPTYIYHRTAKDSITHNYKNLSSGKNYSTN